MSDDWPSTGTLLATRYRLVTLLETGGMAEIWHARDELLGRPVAVKLPTGPQVAWREARMAAKLSHPNIAAVHDYREAVRSDGTVAPFVVMELLAGETVASRLERETFGWPEAARVGAAVADALASAHASGVVHRDIKPGNVMLTPTGTKILDFGISAAAGEPDDDDSGSTFGTPAYVAPERLDGMPAEPATDVYGVGVLLFEMVTGDPPYPVDTWEELAEARKRGPGTLPDTLPKPFRAVVERCLDDDPARRPGADQIRFDLTALWLAETGGEADNPAAERTAEHSFVPVIIPARKSRPTGGRANEERPRESFINAAARTRQQPATDFPAGRSAVAEGRAPAETIQFTPPPPQRRRLALALTVLAMLVAAGGAYAVSSRFRDRTDAGPASPTTKPVNPLYTLVPPSAAAVTPSAGPALGPPPPGPSAPKPLETVGYNDAFAKLRAAIQDGTGSGRIRPDIATDLLNFVGPLQNAKAADVDARIGALRGKINDRAKEGALSPAQATLIRARVTDLERAAGV